MTQKKSYEKDEILSMKNHSPKSSDKLSYAHRSNLEYIEQLYQQYQSEPQSVDTEWQKFFEGVEFAQGGALGFSEKELSVFNLIEAYRDYGHFEADLDPLSNTVSPSDQLALSRFGLNEQDLEKTFQVGSLVGLQNAPLKEIIAFLKSTYCGKLTVQVNDALPDVRQWFIQEMEKGKSSFKLVPDQKKNALKTLSKCEALDKFIHTRYVGTKRFSAEGGDAYFAMMDYMVERSASLGVQEIVFGMAHRGRVNLLVNFLGKKVEEVFGDFNGPLEMVPPLEDYDGDVKYHLGHHITKKTSHGDVEVTMAYNPSHLEAVNTVVLGMARAAQRLHKDTQQRKKVMPMLIHGDAAFAGQGIVAETFQMSQVRGYKVGGTIHLCIDNQVGFTTNPENSRSSNYPSDIAKMISAPVIHCNGDDVESCLRAMDIAVRFRQQWSRDVVINMTCYRRFGHNEGDEPAYTQPLMYDIIKKHPTVREIYAKQLLRENVVEATVPDQWLQKNIEDLQKIYDDVKKTAPKLKPYDLTGTWKGLRRAVAGDMEKPVNTAVDLVTLQKIGKMLAEVPSNFKPHPKLVKLLETRMAMSQGKEKLDWGTAELLAYGSLLTEGHSVRLSGQDCVRGTFTHRHAGFYDVTTNECYMALDQINGDKVEFCVYDSVLSEYGVLGFEYGNSVADPNFLTIWEGQFGDFANGAQIIIDQFISAAESKWQQMSGLVMLLPHGYEGQGPEHSSARLERFLQLCAQNNMQVMNLTTPAQIFHALRRQLKRDFRKPMVVMSPKSLLRHPKAVSSLEDLSKGSFQEVIADDLADKKKVDTVVLVSGKLYYELLEEREKLKNTRTALVRVEQLYPFPAKKVAEVLKSYPALKNIIWAQEEPKNMGSFQYLFFKLFDLMQKEGLEKTRFHYVGRPEKASPAVGSLYRHKTEQADLIAQCFKI